MHTTVFIVLIIIYYVLHSVFADQKVKDIVYKIIPSYLYRIIYSIISIGGLLYLVYAYTTIEHVMFFSSHGVINLLGSVIAVLGLGVILSSYLAFDILEFIGIKQIIRKSPNLKDPLNIKGIYRWVRHPMYTGTLLVTIGLIIFYPEKNLLMVGIITVIYTIVGALLEERKLISQYGDDYRDYQNQVPFILPFKIRKTNA